MRQRTDRPVIAADLPDESTAARLPRVSPEATAPAALPPSPSSPTPATSTESAEAATALLAASAAAPAVDSFRPCALIPSRNHAEHIPRLLQLLRHHGLPIILVNDGSDPEPTAALRRAAHGHPDVTLVELAENQGKGAAVLAGLRAAADLGHTHAFQIDADAQHDIHRVPAFLDAARTHPTALVLGQPRFDASVPRDRLYGRYTSHVWTWLETCSFAIRDAMCGFRIYPIAATLRAADTPRLGLRMDFDPEIAVRLYWQRVPVLNLLVAVHYPADGTSNYRLLADNLRVVRMHVRLMAGAIPRLPGLLRYHGGIDWQERDWKYVEERGNLLAMTLMLKVSRFIGYRNCQRLTPLIVAWFYLTSPRTRRVSRDFQQRVATATGGPPPTRRTIFRHILSFGYTIVDRLAAWQGQITPDRCRWHGLEPLHDCVRRGQGGVILSAHLGNIDMLRALARQHSPIKVTAFMLVKNADKFLAVMRAANPEIDRGLVCSNEVTIGTAVDLQQRIERGEYIVLLADRLVGDTKRPTIDVPFFGDTARFPPGPFILASMLKCRVFTMFCMRQDDGSYDTWVEPFADRIELPRAKRQHALELTAIEYAKRLEIYCSKDPKQWFNFYDFWSRPAK